MKERGATNIKVLSFHVAAFFGVRFFCVGFFGSSFGVLRAFFVCGSTTTIISLKQIKKYTYLNLMNLDPQNIFELILV